MVRNIKHHAVLDAVIRKFGLRNDAHLCKVLGLRPPHVSKVRHGKIESSPDMALAIHEVFGMSFKEMRELDGGVFVGVPEPSHY